MTPKPTPTEHDDPINAQILAISEDKIRGFHVDPFQKIAEGCGIDLPTVLQRIRAMLEAGVIRRVRQTLLANKLAEGALVAWKIPQSNLEAAFDFMAQEDPFSGHVVIRSTDREVSGSSYKLWTTLKVPQGESLQAHGNVLKRLVGAEEFILMPAKGIFTLGVGHVRRRHLEPGSKTDEPARMMTTSLVDLTEEEWKVLLSLKREFAVEEICPDPWRYRAQEVELDLATFCKIASQLDEKKVIGRFSTFLEHVKPSEEGKRVTRFNGLFHWAVPPGMEEQAGEEVGRHHILTHCYWREGGPQFGNVNIMAVAHGMEKERLLQHKAAIDLHLEEKGIPIHYTNIFWGGRSEIKPSEISPDIYRQWHHEYQHAGFSLFS